MPPPPFPVPATVSPLRRIISIFFLIEFKIFIRFYSIFLHHKNEYIIYLLASIRIIGIVCGKLFTTKEIGIIDDKFLLTLRGTFLYLHEVFSML